jgi:hypothetical protein
MRKNLRESADKNEVRLPGAIAVAGIALFAGVEFALLL